MVASSTRNVVGEVEINSTAVSPAAHLLATCATDHAVSAAPATAIAYGAASQTVRWYGSHFVARSNSSVEYHANVPSTTLACAGAAPNSWPITGPDAASASRFVIRIAVSSWCASRIR